MNESYHLPVLLEAVLEALKVKENGTYIDCTVGTGGHSLAILERQNESGLLIGIDKDKEVLQIADERMQKTGKRYHLVHSSYAKLQQILEDLKIKEVDGILFDLGICSFQLDKAERGFAFKFDGPLDMRMDRSKSSITAEELINSLSEEELTECFLQYGEERYAKRIAKEIVKARSFKRIVSTKELAEIIMRAIPNRRQQRIHPATRVFQALRIKVNNELDELQEALEDAFNVLREKGRLVAISYHSLEDRIVKQKFMAHSGKEISLPEGGSRWEGTLPRGKIINKKPIVPNEKEIRINPRSRSAKLRIFERI